LPQQWRREGRKARREQARALAREILQTKNPERVTREKRTKVLTFLGLGAGFGSWGYFALAPEPNVFVGSALLLVCLGFLGTAFWEYSESILTIRVPVLLGGLLLSATGGYYWIHYLSRPSFVLMVPGVILNGNSWDFIINHRGPKSSESVEILFVDKEREQDALKRSPTYLSSEAIQTYQRILRFPEVNPNNRGNIFAKQFVWTPLVLDHEHYVIDITAKDRTVHQELQIERVKDKWLWATQLTDRESGRQLLNCKDVDFPYGDKAPIRCFPEITQPSD
jgi:hypothetical protein